MTLDKCDPCTCVAGYIDTSKFYQDMETILCAIKASTAFPTGASGLLSQSLRVTANGNTTIVAASATNKIYVYGYKMTTGSTTLLLAKFTSGNGGTELDRTLMQAPASITTGVTEAITPPSYLFKTTAVNTPLVLNLDSAQTVDTVIYYYLAP